MLPWLFGRQLQAPLQPINMRRNFIVSYDCITVNYIIPVPVNEIKMKSAILGNLYQYQGC